MLNGEIPPHWNASVTHSSEQVTDESIDIASTWATEDMNYEGYQSNLDPNLVLTRSFRKNPDLTPKPINFDKEPDTPIDNNQNKKVQEINNLIPDIRDIDALTLW